MLTRAEGELRGVSDPRVTLDLVLLKLVQMRRLVPFAELVARVERMMGGAPAASLPAARPTAVRAPALLGAPAASARPLPVAPSRPTTPPPTTVRRDEPPADPPAPTSSPASGSAQSLVAAMIGLCQGRPSLAAPLRSAVARLEGDTLRDRGAGGLPGLRHDARRRVPRPRPPGGGEEPPPEDRGGGAAPSAEPASREPAEDRRQTLREEAEKEPAVQEALDLFDGRVVDVREAKTSREDA